MSSALATPSKLLTAEEFAARPEPPDGSREELVRGRVIVMPPPRLAHGDQQMRVAFVLETWNRQAKWGRIVLETGVVTERGPDSVRGPDVTAWSFARLPKNEVPAIYAQVAPDLVVEILSSGERGKKVEQKIAEYFTAAVGMVWIVDQESRTATVYRRPGEGKVLHEGVSLEGGDILPGFVCTVAELFP